MTVVERLGSKFRARPFAVFIALLLMVRVVVLIIGPGILNGDGILYAKAAQYVAQTGLAPPANFQARTYSVLIAPLVWLLGSAGAAPVAVGQLTTDHPIGIMVHWVQVLLDLAVVLILLRFWRDTRPRAGWAFALGCVVIAVQPITACWTNFALPDTVATASFFAGLYLVARSAGTPPRWRRLAAGSALMGLSGLMRIDMALLGAAVLAPWLLIAFGRRGIIITARSLGVTASLFLLPLVAMATFQGVTQGDPHYISTSAANNPDVQNRGYFAWTRSWVLTPGDFQRFVLNKGGSAEWPGYEIQAYPGRAFASPETRAKVATAISEWRAQGYTPAVDATLQQAADELGHRRPLQKYAFLPLARTAQLWANADGGAAITLTFGLQPPLSWGVAGLTALLKAVLILFSLAGSWVTIAALLKPPLGQAASAYPISIATLSLLAILARFAEMIALNLRVGGGFMESRYVIETWPCIILLALIGWRAAADRLVRSAT